MIRAAGRGGFELLQANTLQFLGGPFETFACALSEARLRNPPAIWQQNVDDRGRPLGDPFYIPDLRNA